LWRALSVLGLGAWLAGCAALRPALPSLSAKRPTAAPAETSQQPTEQPPPSETAQPSQAAASAIAEAAPSPPETTLSLPTGGLQSEHRSLALSGRKLELNVVGVPLGSFAVRVGLAQGRVGCTQELQAIAQRYGAVAAINGCFFDAYSSRPIRNPQHTLITEGRLVHRGEVGTMVGFAPSGEVRLSPVKVKLVGSLDGSESWPNNWYAYWVNRAPESGTAATVFTRYWAEATTPDGGSQIVVRDGVVANVGRGRQQIPEGGYVIYFRGQEEYLASRFHVGQRCAYRVDLQGEGGPGFWAQVSEGLGCGPRLVSSGAVDVHPQAEGFSHPKILSLACARSAVGVTEDGSLLLVTSGAATIGDLARAMKELGCREAMNLDGGASSGLWLRGRYLTSPSRAISNALVIVPRPAAR
jgi:hypothetical protein